MSIPWHSFLYICMVMIRTRRRSGSHWRASTTTFGNTGWELFLLRYLWIWAWLTHKQRQAPVHLPPSLILKSFSLACCIKYKSWMLNNSCITFLGIWLPSLKSLFYKRFLMHSLALEKQNVLFLQKMMWQNVGGMFSKIKTWWWIHHGRDGFNIGKDVPLSGTNLWGLND
jgi:hypothetical protein